MRFLEDVFEWVGKRIDAKSAIFALFLSAGAIKGDGSSGLPVDLTLLLGLLLGVIALFELIKKRARVPGVLKWVLLLFVFFAWGVVFAKNTEYGVEKVSRLFTLTFLAMTAPVIVFRSVEDIGKLINALVLTALIIAVYGLSSLGSGQIVYRMTAGSANTVMTGMLAGVGVIGILLWGLEGTISRFLVSLVCIGIMALALIAAGSKGPIVAVGLSSLVMLVSFYGRKPVAVRRVSVTLAAVIVAAVMAWQMLPSWSIGRLTHFFTGDLEETLSGGRTEHYHDSITLISKNPLGIGWGGYSIASGANGIRWYPHNFILEVTMEAGWGAGICIVMLVITALYRIIRIAFITRDHCAKMLMALLIYLVTAASFSGDINDHRWMLSILSIALASKSIFAEKEEELSGSVSQPAPESSA